MYKVIIDLGDWSWDEDQKLTIETSDFDKALIIQEFVEFQKDHGWAADYEAVEYDEEEVEEEEIEDEVEDELADYVVGDIVEDDDGLVWELVG
jgi:hypothetical protein